MPSEIEIPKQPEQADDSDSILSKIAREAYVIGGGTVSGIKDGLREAASDHYSRKTMPDGTLFEILPEGRPRDFYAPPWLKGPKDKK